MEPDDIYKHLRRALDAGKLPVAVVIEPGLVYYRSFDVEGWSPVFVGGGREREECIVAIARFAMMEGVKHAPHS